VDPSIIGTCSIDTTCTIWDVPTETALTQLIAHDGEVLDIAFADRNGMSNMSTEGFNSPINGLIEYFSLVFIP
jgi:WD repeat-containing protein 68